MMKPVFGRFPLAVGLVSGLVFTAAATESAVSVKVLSLRGQAPVLGGKPLAVGTTLKAQDVLQTGDGTTVELMVNLGETEGPGTLVRVTPNSRMKVLSLTQFTEDDETKMDFEVAATKVGTSSATLAATVTE
jgi:hypothetical protein